MNYHTFKEVMSVAKLPLCDDIREWEIAVKA